MTTKERPVPTITPKMMHIIADLLDVAGERFDDDYDRPAYLTEAEADALDLAAHTWNGDPDEHVPGKPWYSDSTLAHMFADACRAAAGPVEELGSEELVKRAKKEHQKQIELAESCVAANERGLDAAQKRIDDARASLAALKAKQ